MSRVAILSDIHAGLGENDAALRAHQSVAVEGAASFLRDRAIDVLVLNGDTTDHLQNRLSAGTNREITRDVLSPLAAMVDERRGEMRTVLIAGNTDWPLAEPDKENRQVFFDYTGFSPEDVQVASGLWEPFETEDTLIAVTHGHAMHPSHWRMGKRPSAEEYRKFWYRMNRPDLALRWMISATDGVHQADYLKAMIAGAVIRRIPRFFRDSVNRVLGQQWTERHERFYARALRAGAAQTRKKVVGVMGHTHVAGIRTYGGVTIVNTGTASAKPNPLQYLTDTLGHLALLDTEKGTYELVRTFNAARPTAKPERAGGGRL